MTSFTNSFYYFLTSFFRTILILIDYGRPHLSRWDMDGGRTLNRNQVIILKKQNN